MLLKFTFFLFFRIIISLLLNLFPTNQVHVYLSHLKFEGKKKKHEIKVICFFLFM